MREGSAVPPKKRERKNKNPDRNCFFNNNRRHQFDIFYLCFNDGLNYMFSFKELQKIQNLL